MRDKNEYQLHYQNTEREKELAEWKYKLRGAKRTEPLPKPAGLFKKLWWFVTGK